MTATIITKNRKSSNVRRIARVINIILSTTTTMMRSILARSREGAPNYSSRPTSNRFHSSLLSIFLPLFLSLWMNRVESNKDPFSRGEIDQLRWESKAKEAPCITIPRNKEYAVRRKPGESLVTNDPNSKPETRSRREGRDQCSRFRAQRPIYIYLATFNYVLRHLSIPRAKGRKFFLRSCRRARGRGESLPSPRIRRLAK